MKNIFSLTCVLLVCRVSRGLEMEGGVIKDLVVSLDEVLGEENCGWMVRNIGELVKSVSVTLFLKTGGLVRLERVTVRLPALWMCQGEGVEVEEDDGGSDVDVVREGGDPRAVQWGGCGIKGVNIQLPVEALARNDSTTVHTFTTQLHNLLFGTFLEDDSINEDDFTTTKVEVEGNHNVTNVETMANNLNDTVATSEEYDFSSRQMILCGESGASMMVRSVGEQNISSGVAPVASVRVVRRGGLRLTVVLDRSQSEERYSVSRQALYNLVSSLPMGTMLAFIIYTDTARIALQHTQVTQHNIDGLFGRIPGRNVNQKNPCLDCALKLALGLNSSQVLVMSGDVSEFSVSKEVGRMAEEEQVAVDLVAGEVDPSAEVEKLVFKGGLHLTQSLAGGRLLSRMRRTLQEVIGGGRQTIYSSEHRFTGGAVGGSLTVENCRTNSLRVEVITDHMVDIEMFELQDPQGNKHQFPTYQHGVVFFQLKEAAIGTWNYKIKMFGTTSQETPLLVEASAKPSCQDSVSVKKVWTNVGVSGTSARNPPLVIYTQLSHTSQEDLSVTALLQRPGSSSILEIDLLDSGTGYPDISSGDGIYSAYFTDFTTEPGYYRVSIRVTSPSVSLLHTGTQFYITEGIQHYIRDGVPQVRDIFPPSRIMDLVGHIAGNNTLYATLEWTAPGGDYNTGHSHHYEVRCGTHPTQLSKKNFSKEGLSVHETLIPVPQHAGTPQSMTVALPWPNNKFYYAVLAVDQEGNASPVSNLVQIIAPFIEIEEPISSVEQQPINAPVIFNGDFSNASAIYIISGAVCGVLLIVFSIAIVLLIKRRKSFSSDKMENYVSNNITISYPINNKMDDNDGDFQVDYMNKQPEYDLDKGDFMPSVYTRSSLGSSSTASTEYSQDDLYSNSISVISASQASQPPTTPTFSYQIPTTPTFSHQIPPTPTFSHHIPTTPTFPQHFQFDMGSLREKRMQRLESFV